jgi:hypothetical protein
MSGLEEADCKWLLRLCVLKSRTCARLGSLLSIFNDDLKFQTACPKAANQTGLQRKKARELNPFQQQGIRRVQPLIVSFGAGSPRGKSLRRMGKLPLKIFNRTTL